jgi:hypothetical protein
MKPIRAISVRQPYAELILQGRKKKEFRSTGTGIRERVWVYASLRPADDAKAWRLVRCRPGQLPTGVIVGSVEISDCRESDDQYAYALKDPVRLATPKRPINHAQPRFWRPRF